MMRWKQVVVGLALTMAGLIGCKQQCFLTVCDYNDYIQRLSLPPHLETDIQASVTPSMLTQPVPSTTDDPERKPRFLSLAEAISVALEQGTTGSETVVNPGFALDNEVNFSGRFVSGSDNIRVLSLDPAIVGADIERSLSKFDVQWTTSMNWLTTDEPLNGLNQFQSGSSAAFSTGLIKPLPTGGVAGLTFSTNYQKLTNPPLNLVLVNPAYTPRFQLQFEQPLIQGFGVEINQLRASHPGSVLTPFPTGGQVEGILITRLRFDQQRAEFEKNVNFLLLNVEVAYWNLYGSYWDLYSREQALRQAYEAWKISKARFEAGRIPVHDFAQTRQQYELFRGQRLTALGTVLENERQLRGLMGLPGEDGTRLVPIDTPTLTPYQPDWSSAANECLALRPELIVARLDLKFRQLDLINIKNTTLPDLRFTATSSLNGIGNRLDGTHAFHEFPIPPGQTTPPRKETDNAFRSLASDRFVDWALGLRLNVAIGYRDAHAQARVARLNLARSFRVLQDQELKAQRFLQLQYRHLFEFNKQIEIQRAQREAAAIQLESRFREFQAGRGTLDILLEAQRVWADALRAEFLAIVQYNNALVGFEFAKGTILRHDNVVISEGALPECAVKRAVEHERERSEAIVIRERAAPIVHTNGGVPQLPTNEAPPLPSVLEGQPPAPAGTPTLPKLLQDQAPVPDIVEPMVTPDRATTEPIAPMPHKLPQTKEKSSTDNGSELPFPTIQTAPPSPVPSEKADQPRLLLPPIGKTPQPTVPEAKSSSQERP